MKSLESEMSPLEAARAAWATGQLERTAVLAAAAWQAGGALPDADRIEAGFLMCSAHCRLARWAAVLESGVAVAPLLQPADVKRHVQVLGWMALAACELGRFDLALVHAHEACRAAGSAEQPVLLAMSLSSLSMCMERMGDYWQARRLLEEARTLLQGQDDVVAFCVILNALCAVDIGAFYVLRGSDGPQELRAMLETAEALAREALQHLAGTPGQSVFEAVLEANLGEILVHLGRLDEAERLLEDVLRRVTSDGNLSRGWRIRYTRGELLLARGQARAAADELESLRDEMAGTGQTNTLTRVHDALYRSWRAAGDTERALDALERCGHLERTRVVAQLKAQSQLFVTRVEAERTRLEMQRERRRAAELEADAQRDPLTGLGNRRHLERRMPELLAAAARGRPLTLALIDLDHFKRVNDDHGHAVGDRVLVKIADLLRDNTRGSDLLVRMGGEEMLIVLADTVLPVALDVCDRLRQRVQAHDWSSISPGLAVTLSIGLAAAPPHELEALLERADRALYRAKSSGRNRVLAEADGTGA